MIRGLAFSVSWILGGVALVSALFWVFLNTPESTVFTLGLSLLLTLAMAIVAAATTTGAVAGWAAGWKQPVWRRALAGAPAFLGPAMLGVAAWWLIGRGLDWVTLHTGEISAWFIATVDWSDVRPLLNGLQVAGDWLRIVAVPFVALVWLGELMARGWRLVPTRSALARAASPVRLALATAIAATTLWAPLTYGLYWMPRGLPATWVEPAVALAKFGAMALAGAIGLSLIVWLAVARRPDTSPSSSGPG